MKKSLRWVGKFVILPLVVGILIFVVRDKVSDKDLMITALYRVLLPLIEIFHDSVSLGKLALVGASAFILVGLGIEVSKRWMREGVAGRLRGYWLILGAIACLVFGGLWKMTLDTPVISIAIIHPTDDPGNYRVAAELFKSDFYQTPTSLALFDFRYIARDSLIEYFQLPEPIANNGLVKKRILFLAPSEDGYPGNLLAQLFPKIDTILLGGAEGQEIGDISHARRLRVHVSDHEEAREALRVTEEISGNAIRASLITDGSPESKSLCDAFEYWTSQKGISTDQILRSTGGPDVIVACGGFATTQACREYTSENPSGLCFVPAEFITKSYRRKLTATPGRRFFFIDPVPLDAQWRKSITRLSDTEEYARNIPDALLYAGAFAAALDFEDGRYKLNGKNAPVPWIEIFPGEVHLPASTTGWINKEP